MSVDQLIQDAVKEFNSAVEHMKLEFSRLQAGRASASLLDGVKVEAYGTAQDLKAVANITVADARTLQIQPWDKSVLAAVEKAIIAANLNLNPTNDGQMIRIVIPALTEERRRDLTKHVHQLAEDARISIRNSRQKVHARMKDLEKNNEITEDDLRSGDKKLQDKVDVVNKEIEDLAKSKDQDIMTL